MKGNFFQTREKKFVCEKINREYLGAVVSLLCTINFVSYSIFVHNTGL